MSKQPPHRRLRAWQLAMQLCETLYTVTSTFPVDERFGLTSQLRRAAVSVASNIAEGAARSGTADFLRFLFFARGSLSEIDTQLDLARRFGFLDVAQGQSMEHVVEELFATLNGLIRKRRSGP